MTSPTSALDDIRSRFRYEKDGRLDTWRIPRNDTGEIVGDCEEFSLALAYALAGRSLWRFWWEVLTFKSVFWFCKTSRGEGHCTLWRRGEGWTCNIYPSWRQKTPHSLRFPFLAPAVALKLLVGKLAG